MKHAPKTEPGRAPRSAAPRTPARRPARFEGSPAEAPDSQIPVPEDELLILDDGRVLVHHLSPALAELLGVLNPADDAMKQRAPGGDAEIRPSRAVPPD